VVAGRPRVWRPILRGGGDFQALQGRSDNDTLVRPPSIGVLRRPCGRAVKSAAFHATKLTYWRRRLRASGSTRPDR
jgi:hypothetical protein